MQQSGILRSVGGQKERSAVSVFFDKADNLMLGVPVKAGKGFVHDKGITVGEQGAGCRQTPLHASAQGVGRAAEALSWKNLTECRSNLLFLFCLRARSHDKTYIFNGERCSMRRFSWKTAPSRAGTEILPLSASSSPMRMRNRVVLPEPEGPIRQQISPTSTEKRESGKHRKLSVGFKKPAYRNTVFALRGVFRIGRALTEWELPG